MGFPTEVGHGLTILRPKGPLNHPDMAIVVLTGSIRMKAVRTGSRDKPTFSAFLDSESPGGTLQPKGTYLLPPFSWPMGEAKALVPAAAASQPTPGDAGWGELLRAR